MNGPILIAYFREEKLPPYRAALLAAGVPAGAIVPVSPRRDAAADPAGLVAAAAGPA